MDSDDALLNMRIKIARVLYSLEEVALADESMLILDKYKPDEYTLEGDIMLDIILMYIHLVKINEIEDLYRLNIEVFKKGDPISGRILSYFNCYKEPTMATSFIPMLQNDLEIFEDRYFEVQSNLRINSYHFMINELRNLYKNHNKTKGDVKCKHQTSIDKDNIVRCKTFKINENDNKCLFDDIILAKKNIIREVYKGNGKRLRHKKQIMKI